jgi:hypothetical protein
MDFSEMDSVRRRTRVTMHGIEGESVRLGRVAHSICSRTFPGVFSVQIGHPFFFGDRHVTIHFVRFAPHRDAWCRHGRHGRRIANATIQSQIVEHKSTKDDVRAVFGDPSRVG